MSGYSNLVIEIFVFLGKVACHIYHQGFTSGIDLRLGADGPIALYLRELPLFPFKLVCCWSKVILKLDSSRM